MCHDQPMSFSPAASCPSPSPLLIRQPQCVLITHRVFLWRDRQFRLSMPWIILTDQVHYLVDHTSQAIPNFPSWPPPFPPPLANLPICQSHRSRSSGSSRTLTRTLFWAFFLNGTALRQYNAWMWWLWFVQLICSRCACWIVTQSHIRRTVGIDKALLVSDGLSAVSSVNRGRASSWWLMFLCHNLPDLRSWTTRAYSVSTKSLSFPGRCCALVWVICCQVSYLLALIFFFSLLFPLPPHSLWRGFVPLSSILSNDLLLSSAFYSLSVVPSHLLFVLMIPFSFSPSLFS